MRRPKITQTRRIFRRIGRLSVRDHDNAADAVARDIAQRIFDHRGDHCAIRAAAGFPHTYFETRFARQSLSHGIASSARCVPPAGETEAFALIDDDERDVLSRFARFAHPLRLHQAEKHKRDAKRPHNRRPAAAPEVDAERNQREQTKRNERGRRQRRVKTYAPPADHSRPIRSSKAGTCTWSAL